MVVSLVVVLVILVDCQIYHNRDHHLFSNVRKLLYVIEDAGLSSVFYGSFPIKLLIQSTLFFTGFCLAASGRSPGNYSPQFTDQTVQPSATIQSCPFSHYYYHSFQQILPYEVKCVYGITSYGKNGYI